MHLITSPDGVLPLLSEQMMGAGPGAGGDPSLVAVVTSDARGTAGMSRAWVPVGLRWMSPCGR